MKPIEALYDPAKATDPFPGSPLHSAGLEFASCEVHYEYEPSHLDNAGENWRAFDSMPMTGITVGQNPIDLQVTELTERVQYLESIVLQWQNSASYFEVQSAIPVVESITRELFGEAFERVEHEDFEIPGKTLFEINVRCAGDVDAIVKKQAQWHSKIAELPSQTRHLFHLSVDPVD